MFSVFLNFKFTKYKIRQSPRKPDTWQPWELEFLYSLITICMCQISAFCNSPHQKYSHIFQKVWQKRLSKEQITICTYSSVTIAALGEGGTKSLLVEDCTEKLTAPWAVNQITIIWGLGHSDIKQKDSKQARADDQHGLIGQKPRASLLFRAAFWNIWA